MVVRFLKGAATAVILTIIVIPLLLMLPTINFDVVHIINGGVFSYIRAALYFLPVSTVVRILSISLALWTFRVIVAVVRTVWDLLPFF